MIEVKALSFSYGSGGPKILKSLSCDLEQGHCIAVLGNNGAGKSTLLKCISRISHPQEGEVLADGGNIYAMPRRELAKKMAYVPQQSLRSHTMVFDAVLLGRKPYIRWDAAAGDREIVTEIMEKLELLPYAARYLNELSGGELQKVVLARALAQQPGYLLLDEPTSSLDPRNQHEMLRIVKEICDTQKIGVVIVIHDLNLAARYCDRFLFLKDSELYSYGGMETMTPETIRDVYGMETEVIEHRGYKLIVPL